MLGFIDVPLFFLLSLISIIDKGFKFIPCLHINIFHIFMHLLSNINSETIHFNRQINIKNSYSSSHSDSFSNFFSPLLIHLHLLMAMPLFVIRLIVFYSVSKEKALLISIASFLEKLYYLNLSY